MKYEIFPLGDGALTVDFGNEISASLNDRVLRIAKTLQGNSFSGLQEIVPAYSSLTIFYDVFTVRKSFPDFATAFEAVKNLAEKAISQPQNLSNSKPRFVEIPVCYDAEFALDIDFVAQVNKITTAEIIKIHTNQIYRVFMLGFLPGFPYLGELDERIAAPRKTEPRLRVPRGSVGIAGRQTGIYSLESPGGWQIIGRTPLALFDVQSEPPTLLQIGDELQFNEISRQEFAELENK